MQNFETQESNTEYLSKVLERLEEMHLQIKFHWIYTLGSFMWSSHAEEGNPKGRLIELSTLSI